MQIFGQKTHLTFLVAFGRICIPPELFLIVEFIVANNLAKNLM